MIKKLIVAILFMSPIIANALDIQIHIDDSNVDTLSRKLGWTDNVASGPLGSAQIPNPINQSQWIANAMQTYKNNEFNASKVNSAIPTAQQQAIAAATQAEALDSITVTSASKIPPVSQQVTP